MTDVTSTHKAVLHSYLKRRREILLAKLDGLNDYELRRPMTPTGTNLLGLIKHVACMQAEYFGRVFDRPFAQDLPWLAEGAEAEADMWVPESESTHFILELNRASAAHADATIEALELDASGVVPWWPAERQRVTLQQILVHMCMETAHHAGHADIIRELIDGAIGYAPGNDNLSGKTPAQYQQHRDTVERAARVAGTRQELLHAYDAALRLETEVAGALRSQRFAVGLGQVSGPEHDAGQLSQVEGVVAVFAGGHGFISTAHTAREPLDAQGQPASVAPLVEQALLRLHALHTEAQASESGAGVLKSIEFKTRSHDQLPGLEEALAAAGFEPEEPESVMIGTAASLAVEVALPVGVTLHRVTEFSGLLELCQAAGLAFGDEAEQAQDRARDLAARLKAGAEAWVARAEGQVICGGRLEPVPGTGFAGLWGGFTLPQWRGQGIYRALTAARARSALARGFELINSDCTEDSRPILERYGFLKVTETTPYVRQLAD